MNAPWAEHVPPPNLKKLATRLWDVDESQFIQLCHECIPELSFFVGPAEASPSEQTEHTAAKKEELRTLGALMTLYWLLRGFYDQLTRSQSHSRYNGCRFAWLTLIDLLEAPLTVSLNG